MTKVCRQCNEEKPLDKFPSDPRYTDGKRNHCRDCRNGSKRERWDPAKYRDQFLRSKYGLTDEEVGLVQEATHCPICGDKLIKTKAKFAVDHDHSTGKPRGVICNRCNVAIGMMRDDPELLQAAADYLQADRSRVRLITTSS